MRKPNECLYCWWLEKGITEIPAVEKEHWAVDFRLCKEHLGECMSALKFGKFKGQEISEVAKTDEGIGYLEWLKSETKIEGKYAESNKALITEIERCLVGKTRYIPDKEHAPKGKFPPSKSLEICKRIEQKVDLIIKSMGLNVPIEKPKEDDEAPF